MNSVVRGVPDTTECARCGAAVPEDGEGEYRCRFVLEDAARSTYGSSRGKLCFACWDAINEFVANGGQR